MKFLVNLDLNQNEIQNPVLHVLGGDPDTPKEGQLYYSSAVRKIKYRDNVGWQTLLDSSSGVTSVGASSPLSSSGGTTPTISIGSTIGVSLGGTGASSLTLHGILLGNSTSAISATAEPADGQLLIGKTGYFPVLATLTGTGNRLGVSNGAGTITLNVDATQFPSSVSGDTGKALISSAANTAAWGTLGVGGGGTGKTSWTIYSLLYGNGTTAPVELGPLTNGQLVIGSVGAAPVAATLTGTSKRLGVTNGAGSITLNVDTTQFPQAVLGDVGKTLVCSAADTAAWGTLGVAGGGTGLTTLTQYCVLVGAGSGNVSLVGPGTTGQVLMSGNNAANPSFVSVGSVGGDITGSITNLTVNTVGGASAANIADAVGKRHSPNTDTGTTSQTFQLQSGSSGAVLKNLSGLLAVRNSADSAYADFQAKDITCHDITVNGTMTVVHQSELSIGDAYINLNEGITSSAQNANGGVMVTRLSSSVNITGCVDNGSGLIRVSVGTVQTWITGDHVRIDGVTGTTEANNATENPEWTVTKFSTTQFDLQGSTFTNAYISAGTIKKRVDGGIQWDDGSTRWQSNIAADGAASDVIPTYKPIALKYVPAAIGDASNTQFDLAHNLNTRDIVVSVREAATPWNQVIVDVEALDLNTVRIKFASAPASTSKVVTVIG